MKKLYYLLTMLVIAGLIVVQCYRLQEGFKDDTTDNIAVRDDIIRLHIIANSDSPGDQALKLRVRDELLSVFSDIFKDTKNIADARTNITGNLDKLASVAQEKVYSEGYNYPVRADLGIHKFPTKVYGSVIYSAGSYEALKVIIGEGIGANWWCVMFPPLCFVDVSSGGTEASPVEDEDGENQQEIVTEYRFKVVKWWESLINWIKGIFS